MWELLHRWGGVNVNLFSFFCLLLVYTTYCLSWWVDVGWFLWMFFAHNNSYSCVALLWFTCFYFESIYLSWVYLSVILVIFGLSLDYIRSCSSKQYFWQSLWQHPDRPNIPASKPQEQATGYSLPSARTQNHTARPSLTALEPKHRAARYCRV